MGVLDVDLGAAVRELGQALDGLFTSDEERKAGELVLRRLQQEPHRLQGLITLAEAQHRSVFVAGWRPGAGWLCVAGLGYAFVIRPILVDLANLLDIVMLPGSFAVDHLTELLVALLGLGGLRSWDKRNGAAK